MELWSEELKNPQFSPVRTREKRVIGTLGSRNCKSPSGKRLMRDISDMFKKTLPMHLFLQIKAVHNRKLREGSKHSIGLSS